MTGKNIIATKRDLPHFMTREEIEENERQYRRLTNRIYRVVILAGIIIAFGSIAYLSSK